MSMFFEICFGVGVVLTIVLFLFGGLFDLFDGDLDFDLDYFDLHPAIRSPMLLLIFLTVFGGSGMLLLRMEFILDDWIVICSSLVVAGAISSFIQRWIIVPLKRAQNTSTPEEVDLIGLPAHVIETIEEGGCGEITYTIHGNTYCAPAKAVTGERITKETMVAICWIEDYIYYVACFEEGEEE